METQIPLKSMFWFYRRSVTGRLQIGEFLVNGWSSLKIDWCILDELNDTFPAGA